MTIEIGNIVRLGTAADGSMYRIIGLEDGLVYDRTQKSPFHVVRLNRIDDGTTWDVHVKVGASHIPWNTRKMRVTTDADRTRAIDEFRQEIEEHNDTHTGDPTKEQEALETLHWLSASTVADASARNDKKYGPIVFRHTR